MDEKEQSTSYIVKLLFKKNTWHTLCLPVVWRFDLLFYLLYCWENTWAVQYVQGVKALHIVKLFTLLLRKLYFCDEENTSSTVCLLVVVWWGAINIINWNFCVGTCLCSFMLTSAFRKPLRKHCVSGVCVPCPAFKVFTVMKTYEHRFAITVISHEIETRFGVTQASHLC